MVRYFLTVNLVLALAYGVHGASIGEFIGDNYDKILITGGVLLLVGALLYTASCCMEGLLELCKPFTLVLLFIVRCFMICFCCGSLEEVKEDTTNNAVTQSQAPTTNQPTSTTILNIGGVTAQTSQPHTTYMPMPAMSMPVTNIMSMPANTIGMPCMPNSNMTFPVNTMTMPPAYSG